jgi:hypothetical protein
LCASLGSLVLVTFVLWESGTRYPFLHFPLNPELNYFFEESGFFLIVAPLGTV